MCVVITRENKILIKKDSGRKRKKTPFLDQEGIIPANINRAALLGAPMEQAELSRATSQLVLP